MVAVLFISVPVRYAINVQSELEERGFILSLILAQCSDCRLHGELMLGPLTTIALGECISAFSSFRSLSACMKRRNTNSLTDQQRAHTQTFTTTVTTVTAS